MTDHPFPYLPKNTKQLIDHMKVAIGVELLESILTDSEINNAFAQGNLDAGRKMISDMLAVGLKENQSD